MLTSRIPFHSLCVIGKEDRKSFSLITAHLTHTEGTVTGCVSRALRCRQYPLPTPSQVSRHPIVDAQPQLRTQGSGCLIITMRRGSLYHTHHLELSDGPRAIVNLTPSYLFTLSNPPYVRRIAQWSKTERWRLLFKQLTNFTTLGEHLGIVCFCWSITHYQLRPPPLYTSLTVPFLGVNITLRLLSFCPTHFPLG